VKDAKLGFPERARRVPVPDLFFSRYLPRIADPAELKVFLHVLWRVYRRQRRSVPAVRLSDLVADPTLVRSLASIAHSTGAHNLAATLSFGPEAHTATVAGAIDSLVDGGLLVDALVGEGDARDRWIWVNDPAGRRARDSSLAEGMPGEARMPPAMETLPEGSSIFSLYEENIGPLTPLLAEELAEAEAQYSASRIEAAFRAAVEANVRKWSYVRAILARMSKERGDAADRESGEGSRARYLEGPYADYIEG
jgi:DnaD/phage-associated family protein